MVSSQVRAALTTTKRPQRAHLEMSRPSSKLPELPQTLARDSQKRPRLSLHPRRPCENLFTGQRPSVVLERPRDHERAAGETVPKDKEYSRQHQKARGDVPSLGQANSPHLPCVDSTVQPANVGSRLMCMPSRRTPSPRLPRASRRPAGHRAPSTVQVRPADPRWQRAPDRLRTARRRPDRGALAHHVPGRASAQYKNRKFPGRGA